MLLFNRRTHEARRLAAEAYPRWKYILAARGRRAARRLIGLPALSGKTRFLTRPSPRACAPPSCASSRARARIAIHIRWGRHCTSFPERAACRIGAGSCRKSAPATWFGFARRKAMARRCALNTTMVHVAIAEILDSKFVEWLEKVTDQQYTTRRIALCATPAAAVSGGPGQASVCHGTVTGVFQGDPMPGGSGDFEALAAPTHFRGR